MHMNTCMCGRQEDGGEGYSVTVVELLIHFLLLHFYIDSFLPMTLAILASEERNFLFLRNTSSALASFISLEVKSWCRS